MTGDPFFQESSALSAHVAPTHGLNVFLKTKISQKKFMNRRKPITYIAQMYLK